MIARPPRSPLFPYTPLSRSLSGQRLAAERERILAEARAELTLSRLGTDGAFRLLDPRYRFTASTAHLVAELPGALAWVRARGLGVEPVELGALALTGDEPQAIATAALERLPFPGEPLPRLRPALAEGRAPRAPLPDANAPRPRARVPPEHAPA